MNDKKNVLVVGAGPAGLTAAYELLKNAGDRFNVILPQNSATVRGPLKTREHLIGEINEINVQVIR